jgi:hypothetical protein
LKQDAQPKIVMTAERKPKKQTYANQEVFLEGGHLIPKLSIEQTPSFLFVNTTPLLKEEWNAVCYA